MEVSTIKTTGITPHVNTLTSNYSLLNLIEIITEKKIDAIFEWLEKKSFSPDRCLIIGLYLTGLRLANILCNTCSVTVMDIYPHLKGFLDPRVNFIGELSEVKGETFELVVDTSGLGGIEHEILNQILEIKCFIVEEPCSDGSCRYIQEFSQTKKLLTSVNSQNCGFLYTYGLNSNTSGTMTLMIEVIRRAMEVELAKDGVLYCTSHLDFFEGIIFKDKDPETFLKKLSAPALIVSSLKDVKCDMVLDNILKEIKSEVIELNGGKF